MEQNSPLTECLTLLELLAPRSVDDYEMLLARHGVQQYLARRGCRSAIDRAQALWPLKAKYAAGSAASPHIVAYIDELSGTFAVTN